ncbi:LarC family nickel insertion protein [Lactiplantibacillus pentosus]|nr:LarC family nickel insertion protein [Lactiplantibacillus pentosus]
MGLANEIRVALTRCERSYSKKKLSQQVVEQTADAVLMIEANLDDQTGEGLGYVMNQLLTAGAYDVFFTPIQMKKIGQRLS